MARIQVAHKGIFTCDSNTAEEAVEFLREALDEPWHGNVLLSCGPHKLETTQQLREFNADFVFANYSWLSSGPPIHIGATELRGITIEQLSSLLVFVEGIASGWCEAHHLGYGQPLSFEAFNLYHANFWVIGPATAGHGRGGCSYVELVANSAQMQRPLWFVSHAWLEPVCKFVACLKRHASLRQLSEQTAYWVCAYANNQHQLQDEICNNPRKTSFYRAIKLCVGVLLVLDEDATPFTRIWCCFEESIAVEERNKGSPLLLDVAATEHDQAHVITDGLVGSEQQMMPLLGFLAKSRREAEFPTEILMKGLNVDIASAMASEASDKTKILNSIRLPRAGTKILQEEAQEMHESYDAVGRALAGHFALANWFSSVANGLDTSRLLTALQRDDQRRVVQLSLTGCCKFDDVQLTTFLQHLPPHLQILRLDLGFTAVERVQLGSPLAELQALSLRFTKTPLRQVNLQQRMMPKLRSLQLWLSSLPELEELQVDSNITQAVRELVLHVHGCPKLPQSAKQDLYDSVHRWRCSTVDKWISIEEVQRAWLQFPAVAAASVHHKPQKAKLDATAMDGTEMPFPCSHGDCPNFHDSSHGFCHRHRFTRMWRKAWSGVSRTFNWMELILLLTIQAAAEIQSRFLLLLVLLSLLPVTSIFLERSTGMSVASICITFLVVAVGSCVYTARRLDGMQQSAFNMALATEASYFAVLQSADTDEDLVQVSTILGQPESSPPKVLQMEDFRSSYTEAKHQMMSHFQTAVCDPLASAGFQVIAKLQFLTELDEREGGADILFCQVLCDGLQEVQHAWNVLKDLDVEIISARDFFAFASSKKCCRIVVSLQGFPATIFLLEKTLSFLEDLKGIGDAANSLGLLDKTKAEHWEVSRLQGVSEVPKSVVLVMLTVLRPVSFFASVVIGMYIHLTHSDRGVDLLQTWALALPFWICSAILVWDFFSGVCPTETAGGAASVPRIRPRPTQIWYRKYFGVQGSHYAFKVGVLQLITVAIQGVAKASVFHILRDAHGSEVLRTSSVFQCFMVLILSNILVAALILACPNHVVARVAAALMDAILDVGYMITSILLYVVFATQESLEILVLGNFWNFMSVYICIAHVLCVCRSLETADWVALFQVPRADPFWGAWKRVLFPVTYACTLVAFVGVTLGGIVLSPDDPNNGLCPPCECSTDASTLLLERCPIPTGYFASQAPPLVFDLSMRNISEILPDALVGGGMHQRVRSLSLRGNLLTELPEGLFLDLLDQKMDSMDLSQNRLTALSPTIFHSSSSQNVQIDTLHLEGNHLTTLPPGVFNVVTLQQLHLEDNNLTHLQKDSFRGLTFAFWPVYYVYAREKRSLDLSKNQLQDLPPRVFSHLKYLRTLNLGGNRLGSLNSDSFSLENLEELNLEQNQLMNLGNGSVFNTMPKLKRLNLQGNRLRSLNSGSFSLENLEELNLEQNQLTDLGNGSVFNTMPKLRMLKLGGNGFTSLPHFYWLDGWSLATRWSHLEFLDISWNKLQEWPIRRLDKLRSLNLKGNRLTSIPLIQCRDLEVLNLEQNRLYWLDRAAFHWMESLRELNLGGNQLTHLYSYTFHASYGHGRMTRLQHLHLHSNRLVTLPQGIFENLTSLATLNLSKNFVKELPPGLFRGLNELSVIDLSQNNLTTLNAELFDLAKLVTLDLRANPLTESTRQDLAHLKLKLYLD